MEITLINQEKLFTISSVILKKFLEKSKNSYSRGDLAGVNICNSNDRVRMSATNGNILSIFWLDIYTVYGFKFTVLPKSVNELIKLCREHVGDVIVKRGLKKSWRGDSEVYLFCFGEVEYECKYKGWGYPDLDYFISSLPEKETGRITGKKSKLLAGFKEVGQQGYLNRVELDIGGKTMKGYESDYEVSVSGNGEGRIIVDSKLAIKMLKACFCKEMVIRCYGEREAMRITDNGEGYRGLHLIMGMAG